MNHQEQQIIQRPMDLQEPPPDELINMPALRALTAGDVIRLRDFYDANGVFIGNRNQVIDTTKSSSSENGKEMLSR